MMSEVSRGLTFVFAGLLVPIFAGCAKDPGGPSVPDRIQGVYQTVNTRDTGNVSFSLNGYFGSASIETPQYWRDVVNGFADLADGDCAAVNTINLYDSTNNLDAGEFLSLTTPAGELQVGRIVFNSNTFYRSLDPGGAHFAPKAGYTLAGDGDPAEVDIGPFSAGWTGAEDVTVTAPDLAASVAIDRFVDLEVTWSSTGGSAPVFVHLRQQDAQANTIHEELCKFDDDGSGTVRSPTLDNFDPTLPAVSDGISVGKITAGSFGVPGLDAPVIVVSQSFVSAGVQFQ